MNADKDALYEKAAKGLAASTTLYGVDSFMWRIKMIFGSGNNFFLNIAPDVISFYLLQPMKEGIEQPVAPNA